MTLAREFIDRIRAFDLLKHLPAEALDDLLGRATILSFLAGDVVYEQGQQDNFVNYLIEGRVERFVEGTFQNTIDADKDRWTRPLDLAGAKRHTVRAVSPIVVLRLSRRELERVLEHYYPSERDGVLEVTDISSDASEDWKTRLLRSELFTRLSASTIHRIFARMEEVCVAAGDEIVHQREPGDDFYVIQKGACEVIRQAPGGGQEVHLANLGPGDGFGEEALILGTPRNATVRMSSDGRLVRLSGADFNELILQPLVQGVSFRQSCWLVAQGASWLDARNPEDYHAGAPPGAVNVPVHLLRIHCRKLDRSKSYVVCHDDVRRSILGAFLMAQHGFDASYLEVPITPCLARRPATVASMSTPMAVVDGNERDEGNVMSERKRGNGDHEAEESTTSSASGGNGTGDRHGVDAQTGRAAREDLGDTTTGEELANLIEELDRRLEQFDDSKPGEAIGSPGAVSPVSGGSGQGRADAESQSPSHVGTAPESAAARRRTTAAELEQALSTIIEDMDVKLTRYITQSMDSHQQKLLSTLAEHTAALRRTVLDRIEAHEAALREQYERSYGQKQQLLRQDYDRLIALANRISRQKADIQKARKALESMLRTADRVHREVFRVGSALAKQIDDLGEIGDDISMH